MLTAVSSAATKILFLIVPLRIILFSWSYLDEPEYSKAELEEIGAIVWGTFIQGGGTIPWGDGLGEIFTEPTEP